MHTTLFAAHAATRNVPRLLLGTFLTFSLLRPIHAQLYTITDLGVLSGQTESDGYALSPNGLVAGDSGGHTFYWNGTLHDTGLSGYSNVGINDTGQVVAGSTLYNIGSGITYAPGDLILGDGINAGGQVSGYGSANNDTVVHAFRWTPANPNGMTGTSLDVDGQGSNEFYSRANAINDAGEVCGFVDVSDDSDYNYYADPFVWAGGSPGLTDIGLLPGDGIGASFGISSFGHVVGQTQSYYIKDDGFGSRTVVITGTHAFLWTPTATHGTNGSMQAVGTLGGDSIAYGVNAIPLVVGTSSNAAFVWDTGNGIRDLNTLIPAPSAWKLTTARAINDAGQITGSGTIGGRTHAYLLTPSAAAPPVAVSRIAVSPGTVYKGAETFGKVSLVDYAPAGGETVTLAKSGSAIASIPASVVVPAGQKYVTFAIGTNGSITTDTTVSLTATAGGASASTSVHVLTRYTANGTITGKGSTSIPVTAKASGAFLLTASASPDAVIPDNSAYTLSSPLSVNATGTITNIVVGVNIKHPHIADLVVTLVGPDGTSVALQNQTGGTPRNLLTSYPVLNAPAQSLSAFNGKAAGGTWTLKVQDLHPGNAGTLNSWNVTFNYNGTLTQTAVTDTNGKFSIPSLKAATYTVTPVSNTFSSAPASRAVTVGPNATGVDFSVGPIIKSVTLSSSKKTGGNTVTGTVTLAGQTDQDGQVVNLSSSNTGAATVPSSVMIAPGTASATFTITTKPTASPTAVTLMASTGGAPASATLTVNPGLAGVSVHPGTAKGGSHPTGTVTLSGPAASDLTVTLASSNPAVASGPNTVLVPTGATSATFTVTTHTVASNTLVTLSATLGITKTTTLAVTH